MYGWVSLYVRDVCGSRRGIKETGYDVVGCALIYRSNLAESGRPSSPAARSLYENLTDGDDSNDPFILSVRSAEDYAKGHIPGAYNVPWKNVAVDLTKYPTDKQIVTYCYTGHTGQVGAVSLALLGYDVTNLKYGMMGWTDDAEVLAQPAFEGPAGYPVQTEANEL